MNDFLRTLVFCLSFFLSLSVPGLSAAASDNASVDDTIAVLITGWGMPAAYNFDYAWTSSDYPRIGDLTEYEGQPCKIGHVGEYPYASHIGMIPFGITFLVEEDKLFFDFHGIYYFENDEYVHPHPDVASLSPAEIPDGTPVTPLKDVAGHTGDLSYPVDPRTGEDYLEGWYRIGDWDNPLPNGIHDMVEAGPPLYIRYYGIMGASTDPTGPHVPPPAVEEQDAYLEQLMEDAFGHRIDIRYGQYTAVPGETKMMDDVAEEFADEGFTKMLLARETTDYNNYALNFMTGNYIKERLCELGVLDSMEIHFSRQVGRTPEFNLMNIRNLKPYIEAHPAGSTIGFIYVTRGLTWGKQETSGSFGAPHPWSKEVYHDNAYLNYLSLKEALIREFGDTYTLVFAKGGKQSDLREDSFYAYGLGNDIDLKGYGGETVFSNVRDVLDLAKEDGLDKIIIAPCHWNYDNLDTIFRMQEINGMPIAPLDNLKAGIYANTYCEDSDGAEVSCDGRDAVARITVAPSYSDVAEEFATAYYVVLRGALERFGLYPEGEEPLIEASQKVTKLSGGSVEVTAMSSTIAGAKITIPADPYPDRPEGFTPETAVPVNDPTDTNDCMWEDTVINIGYLSDPPAMDNATLAGPAVYFGPYRTFFNRDVTVTIPFDAASAAGGNVNVYIYNHVSKGWDLIGKESVQDGLVSCKTKVLGLFRAGVQAVSLTEIKSIVAVPGSNKARIYWTTESEIDTYGFNIFRADSEDGEYTKVNSALISSKGPGSVYSFKDTGVKNSSTYYYRFESMDFSGRSSLGSPVTVTPRLLFWPFAW